ncbi:hypothetical protein M408DRAFT_171514 [Serendipita vermifera MAFF 305830]|uniref:Uncharacterized protein n=1 Tax=Serendipita vermifera MAFF 305830 TaxID=933852 RepID=A0A0C2WLQ6_SERVB|nr:hypothetical protein M408DRAFT_171514 [Serendipita vermifera MAFF 305830]
MITSGTDISTLNPSIDPQGEIESAIRAIVEPLETESKKEIEAIKLKAQAHRSELEKQIRLSRDIEQADIQVCKIRLSGEIARIRSEFYGESQSPTVGPIRGLPVEMLSYVFRYHVESGSSPWVLAKVSKLWMHTALSTPQLWSHIRVGIHGPSPALVWYVVNGRKEYSIGQKQVCSDTIQVDAALRRSGEVPLSLEFACPDWNQHSVVNSTFLKILNPPLSHRVQSLNIVDAYIPNGTIPDDTPIGPFPRLLSLKLPKNPNDWVNRLLKAVSETSHSLQVISLGGVRYLAHAFPTVEDLTLEYPQNDEMIIAILKSMPRIRKVTISSYNQEFGLELLERFLSGSEPLLCPNLEVLLLGDEFHRFSLPKGKAAPLVKKLVKVRQQIGKPLRELTIHWNFRSEVVNYA